MGKENAAIKAVLQTAIKLSPLMYVLIGATGTYYSLKGDIDNARKDLQEHCAEFSHGNWMSSRGLEHPALRSAVERLIERECEERVERLKQEHRLWPCELEEDRRLDRLFDLNPTLRRP